MTTRREGEPLGAMGGAEKPALGVVCGTARPGGVRSCAAASERCRPETQRRAGPRSSPQAQGGRPAGSTPQSFHRAPRPLQEAPIHTRVFLRPRVGARHGRSCALHPGDAGEHNLGGPGAGAGVCSSLRLPGRNPSWRTRSDTVTAWQLHSWRFSAPCWAPAVRNEGEAHSQVPLPTATMLSRVWCGR